MESFLEVLKYVLPSLVVFATAYYTLKPFVDREEKRMKGELALANQKLMTPIRLQAYERLVLFLERISPDSLLMRVQVQDLSAKQLRMLLIKTIRSEYEHNLSQQLYVSSDAWQQVKNAKEGLTQLINFAESELLPNASGIDLSKGLLEALVEHNESPTQKAIDFLRKEAVSNF